MFGASKRISLVDYYLQSTDEEEDPNHPEHNRLSEDLLGGWRSQHPHDGTSLRSKRAVEGTMTRRQME